MSVLRTVLLDRLEDVMKRALLVSALLTGAVAFAQGPGAAKAPTTEDLLVTAAQMQDILQKGPVKDGKPGSLSTRLFNASTYSCAFIRLSEPDKPHAHGQWSEVLVIREGSGTIVTGGKMLGPFTSNSAVHQSFFVDKDGKSTAVEGQGGGSARDRVQSGDPPPGADAAGTAIENGRVQEVKPGDIVLIPAGVAHTWTKVDSPVVYLDIKFPKATD